MGLFGTDDKKQIIEVDRIVEYIKDSIKRGRWSIHERYSKIYKGYVSSYVEMKLTCRTNVKLDDWCFRDIEERVCIGERKEWHCTFKQNGNGMLTELTVDIVIMLPETDWSGFHKESEINKAKDEIHRLQERIEWLKSL